MENSKRRQPNPRITARERGLIKGAVRRAFARSDLHQQVLDSQAIEHEDPKRPRCRRWGWCAQCGEVVPRWTMSVDHVSPIIGIQESFEALSLDEVVDRLWCEGQGLQGLCEPCHSAKTKAENCARRAHKKSNKSTGTK